MYDGVLLKRGALVVSDLDRAFKVWIDLFGMEVDSLIEQSPDSLAYDLFDVPEEAKTRFATLNAGDQQMRTLGMLEVKGVEYPQQTGIRRGGVVMNANGRLDTIRAALPGIGLAMLREKPLTVDGQGTGTETGFHDWDGNLIVLYQLPG